MAELRGILPVLCTPFGVGGDIDYASFERLVEFVLSCGVHGITVCGIASEANKLTLAERREVTERAARQIAGRSPFVAGASHESIDSVIALAEHAAAAGARGLMISPPASTRGEPSAVERFYLDVAARAGGLPILIQDNPVAAGFSISAEVLLTLASKANNLRWAKLEGPPTGPKLSRVLADSGGRFKLFGGLGGQFILEELARGAAGCLPGAAFPEAHVNIWEAFHAGERDRAARIYRSHMALMRFVGQSVDWSHHCYKTLLWKGGILTTPAVRPPAAGIDSIAIEQLLGHARAAEIRLFQ